MDCGVGEGNSKTRALKLASFSILGSCVSNVMMELLATLFTRIFVTPTELQELR